MPNISIQHIRIAANTSTGDQTLAIISGPGTAPVAALFFMNTCIANNTERVHDQICIGATDGTNSRCVMRSSENNVSTTNTWQKSLNDVVLMTVNPTTGTLDGYATFVSFNADNVIINWGDAPTIAQFIDVILWFGTGMDVKVGDYDASTDTSKSIGFRPEQMYGFGNLTAFTSKSTTSSTVNGCMSIGILSDQYGVLTQRSYQWLDVDGNNLLLFAGSVDTFLSTTTFSGDTITVSSTLTPTSTGFNINGTGGFIGFLAISYNGQVLTKTGLLDTLTATGSQVITDPGFEPQFVLEIQSFLTAYDTDNNDTGGTYGIGIHSASNAPTANSLAGRTYWPLLGPSETRSHQSGTAATNRSELQRNTNNSSNINSTHTSFDSLGYTKNYTAVNATVRKNVYIATGYVIPLYIGWADEEILLPIESDEVMNYG